jgi:phosphoribosylformylglycinamidine cyclo-ligase
MAGTKESMESAAYAALGASSAKGGVLKAVGEHATSRYFATPLADPFGDPSQAFFLHADGAGTKSIVAYLMFRETGDPSWFRSLAIDSLVMNLDDLACAGALSGLALSNTIGRNRLLIPDEAISQIIDGYRECVTALRAHGISIALSGGETADVGDLVRTIIVDSTLSARIPREALVDAYRVTDGDVIVGFSSTGKTAHEAFANSGIGSNGLTLARNVLLSRYHIDTYPESGDPSISADVAYRGPFKVTDVAPTLGDTIGSALLAPTRSYAPLIHRALTEFRTAIHSLVHCTGGGQVKIKRFGQRVRFEKDNLFETPPLFSLIQEHGRVPWAEMYSVFNMGHRLEACVEPSVASELIDLAAQFGIAAKIVGRVSSTSGDNEVIISSPHGEFIY